MLADICAPSHYITWSDSELLFSKTPFKSIQVAFSPIKNRFDITVTLLALFKNHTFWHYNDVTWASGRLMSPTTGLFFYQKFVELTSKDTKYRSFVRGIHRWQPRGFPSLRASNAGSFPVPCHAMPSVMLSPGEGGMKRWGEGWTASIPICAYLQEFPGRVYVAVSCGGYVAAVFVAAAGLLRTSLRLAGLRPQLIGLVPVTKDDFVILTPDSAIN